MESNGVKKTSSATNRHRRSPSSDRFLDLFSPSPPSSVATDGDELNEDDVLWTGDFTATSELTEETIKNDTDIRSVFTGISGILAALPEANNRNLPVLHRKSSIPKPPPPPQDQMENSLLRTHSLSKSVPTSRKFMNHSSAPVNVPVLSAAMAMQRKSKFGGIEDVEPEEEEDGGGEDDDDDNVVLPPHELVAHGSGVSPRTTFSVLEGVGRTLKGRDLRQVRNAVWRKTGFLD